MACEANVHAGWWGLAGTTTLGVPVLRDVGQNAANSCRTLMPALSFKVYLRQSRATNLWQLSSLLILVANARCSPQPE